MNRIILLGNGFDLAHGLPTKYSDFFYNYIRKVFTTRNYDDDHISWESSYSFQSIRDSINLQDLLLNIKKEKKLMHNNFKNKFLEQLIEMYSFEKWVDIECYYYEVMTIILSQNVKAQAVIKQLKELNDGFIGIKKLLEGYLVNNVENVYRKQCAREFIEIFNQEILYKDVDDDLINYGNTPEETLLLNFNYTSTISPYFKTISYKPTIINIHGELGSLTNPIIFGFGDEFDSKYSEIESIGSNDFFTHMKSFMYLKSSNYRNLIRFMDSKEYQVYVIGHSCGLSDRTMLNYLFENENCKSIKIFYHKDEDNFINTTQEISRHFRKNKHSMRMKIVPYDKSEPCPQVQLEKIERTT